MTCVREVNKQKFNNLSQATVEGVRDSKRQRVKERLYMKRRGSKSVYFIASMLEGYLFWGEGGQRAFEMTPQGNNIGFKTSLFDVFHKNHQPYLSYSFYKISYTWKLIQYLFTIMGYFLFFFSVGGRGSFWALSKTTVGVSAVCRTVPQYKCLCSFFIHHKLHDVLMQMVYLGCCHQRDHSWQINFFCGIHIYGFNVKQTSRLNWWI